MFSGHDSHSDLVLDKEELKFLYKHLCLVDLIELLIVPGQIFSVSIKVSLTSTLTNWCLQERSSKTDNNQIGWCWCSHVQYKPNPF